MKSKYKFLKKESYKETKVYYNSNYWSFSEWYDDYDGYDDGYDDIIDYDYLEEVSYEHSICRRNKYIIKDFTVSTGRKIDMFSIYTKEKRRELKINSILGKDLHIEEYQGNRIEDFIKK